MASDTLRILLKCQEKTNIKEIKTINTLSMTPVIAVFINSHKLF